MFKLTIRMTDKNSIECMVYRKYCTEFDPNHCVNFKLSMFYNSGHSSKTNPSERSFCPRDVTIILTFPLFLLLGWKLSYRTVRISPLPSRHFSRCRSVLARKLICVRDLLFFAQDISFTFLTRCFFYLLSFHQSSKKKLRTSCH